MLVETFPLYLAAKCLLTSIFFALFAPLCEMSLYIAMYIYIYIYTFVVFTCARHAFTSVCMPCGKERNQQQYIES